MLIINNNQKRPLAGQAGNRSGRIPGEAMGMNDENEILR
jgi:hypothetical protein